MAIIANRAVSPNVIFSPVSKWYPDHMLPSTAQMLIHDKAKEAKTGIRVSFASILYFFPRVDWYVAALAINEPEKINSNPAKAIAPERTARITSLSGKARRIYHDFFKLYQCRPASQCYASALVEIQ